jgi:hypothetical protein
MLNYECTFRTFLIFRRDCIKDFGVYIDCKICFQHHVDYIFSHVMTLQGQIRTIASSFSTAGSVMMYFVRSDLSLSMLLLHETRLQLLTRPLLQHILFQNILYNYDKFVENLNLQDTAYHESSLGCLVLINIYNNFKCCLTVLETVGIGVPARGIRSSVFLIALSVTFLQMDVLLLLMQFVSW